MRRDEALRIIRAHEAELRAMGVESIELFGSVARDEAGPESDVDVLVKFSDNVRRSGWEYVDHYFGVRDLIGEAVGTKVDVASLPLARTRFGYTVAKERVHVF